MTTSNNFREYLGRDAFGVERIRMGQTVYAIKGHKVYIERNGESQLITLETHVAKPWIQRNIDAELSFQKKKQLAIALQKTYIPSYERKAYKRRMGWFA